MNATEFFVSSRAFPDDVFRMSSVRLRNAGRVSLESRFDMNGASLSGQSALRVFLHPPTGCFSSPRKSCKLRRTLARHSFCVNAGTPIDGRYLSRSIQDGTLWGCGRKTIYVIVGDTLCHSGILIGNIKRLFSYSYGLRLMGKHVQLLLLGTSSSGFLLCANRYPGDPPDGE